MEELFRFLLTRPVQQVDAENDTVAVSPAKAYHEDLRRARTAAQPPAALRRVADAERRSAHHLHALSQLGSYDGMKQLLDELLSKGDMSLEDLAGLVQEYLGSTPGALIETDDFVRSKTRLADVIVTSAILSNEGGVSLHEAATYLRLMAAIERLAAGDKELEVEGGIASALGRVLMLPADVFPLQRPPGASGGHETPGSSESGPDKNRIERLTRQRDELLGTYKLLTRVVPEQLRRPLEGEPESESLEFRPRAAFPPLPGEPGRESRKEGDAPEAPHTTTFGLARSSPLMLRAEVVEALDSRDREVLATRGLDLNRIGLPTAIERLSFELRHLELDLAELTTPMSGKMVLVGNKFVPAAAAGFALPPLIKPGVLGSLQVPTTYGDVAPAGIGDLLVVKQFLKRYETRELAHIENVLQGEFKERMHRRARTTEETITFETEVKREEERDLQTTERFELKSESSEVQKQDTSLKVGLAVSGKYGPVVEFKATTDFALSQSKEEATKVATSYSKDVTSRATSRIFERRREERILKTIEVFEERNTHGIDNKAGDGHVIGQYQWVDKIYEAQVFNYGKRLLFDIMLPEPAAFWLHAVSEQPKAGADLVEPAPFTLKPTDISEWNYAYYVKQYEVVGVAPPPQPYVTVAKAIEGKGSKDDGVTKTLEIPLPDGYQAVAYEWVSRANKWDDGTLRVMIVPEPINNKVGSISLAVKGRKIEVFVVALAISCQRTQRTLDEWKLKTHAAILQAYQKLVRDYEEKLAALEVQAAQEIQGRNPVENQRLIRAELKKGAISTFTSQHYDLFGAITTSPQGYPQPDLPEAAAEGRYIRFFEQAFEWEQMVYFFYPYFWGRKSNWLNRALLQDVDPLFAEFIKAGSARIVVPVRPAFEQAIAHFLESGQIWDGGDLPPIGSPLYVSIIEEIRERDQAPGDEIPQGEPWDVRLPTTLVKLREEPGLPAWQKNAQGEWEPV